MSHKTPKTLVRHGIALLLKDRNIATVGGTPTLTDWSKGHYSLAIGAIETFNGVTGAFTATLTVGVPGNPEGNTFAVSGSLEALTGAPLEPGTRATHTSGTHTLTGETEIPAYACYLGNPVYSESDPAWHEVLPGDTLFTPGASHSLTATHVYKAGVIAVQPNGEPYAFIDGVISHDMHNAIRGENAPCYTRYGHVGAWGDTVTFDAGTGEAIAQFAKALPYHPVRALEYGLTALEPRNLADICNGGFIDAVMLETLLPNVSPKEVHATALTILTENTLKALDDTERELAGIRERLEALHRSLREFELYSKEVAQEITDNVK